MYPDGVESIACAPDALWSVGQMARTRPVEAYDGWRIWFEANQCFLVRIKSPHYDIIPQFEIHVSRKFRGGGDSFFLFLGFLALCTIMRK